MADLKLEELRAALAQLGETAPKTWTRAEIRVRLEELTGEDLSKNVKSKHQDVSPAQQLTKKLNAAANRRKADLVSFCEQELRMSNIDKWTMNRIQMEGLKKVLEITEGDFRDLVSFGKHGLLTYQELYDQDKSYCRWVVETAQERQEKSDFRLRRLARWIQKQDEEELKPESSRQMGRPILSPPPEKRLQGYPEHGAVQREQGRALGCLDGGDQGAECRGPEPEGRAPAGAQEGEGQGRGDARDRRLLCDDLSTTGLDGKAECGMSEDESGACQNLSASQKLSQQLSLSKARHLEEVAWGVVPGLLQELLTTERRVLLEIACAPDSRLTTTVQSLSSDSSAARCTGPWDGMDLSLDSGVRAALRLLETERPTHVWLAPPVGPYCTLQNANAQNPQQAETLQCKREAAMRAYVGACVIFHACVQQGIHVTLEMSERCQAWRLPLFQRLQSKYQLYSAVTKGCRVGLRSSSEGPLMQKGWKILTTQKRLASLVHLGCHCPKSYKHGRCEGASTGRSDTYTSEYTRRAAKAILQELDHTTVAQECHGTSVLPVQFGEGLCCTCSEVHLPGRPRQCAFCLGSKPEDTEGPSISSETPEHPEAEDSTFGSPSVGPEASNSALCSQVELSQLEQLARQLRQGKDYRHQACNTLLEMFPGSRDVTSSHGPGMDPRKYITFGLYSHGNHYGITRVTRQLPQVIRYLLEYFKHWAGSLPVATSLVVNLNQRCD